MKYKPYKLEDVVNASNQNKFNVISTFAGGGGSSTGYRLAGGKILCINEFVEETQNTYRENYPDTPILPGYSTSKSCLVKTFWILLDLVLEN